MNKLGIYLAFDNAKESMDYYAEIMNAKIIRQLAITKEMNEHFKLDVDKLENSTYSGGFVIDGIEIACSDKVDNNGEFNDSFNLMMEYSDVDAFNAMCDRLRGFDGKAGEVIFDSTKDENMVDMKMFRFKDKYNIIWSFIVQ